MSITNPAFGVARVDPFQRKLPGDTFEPSADWYNLPIDTAIAQRGHAHDQSRHNEASWRRSAVYIRIKNTSGVNWPAFSVVALGDPLFTPTQNLDEFKFGDLTFSGIVPTTADEGRFAITQNPIPSGEDGRAVLVGYSRVQLQIAEGTEESLDTAGIDDGKTTHLRPISGGYTKILWRELGFGTKWAIVRLGVPSQSKTIKYVVAQGATGSGVWEVNNGDPKVSVKFCDDRFGANPTGDTFDLYLPTPPSKDPNIHAGNILLIEQNESGQWVPTSDGYLDDRVGTVKAWVGDAADLPQGWEWMNGTDNSAPHSALDTRNRYLKGVQSGSPGTTGGSEEHGHDAHDVSDPDHGIDDHGSIDTPLETEYESIVIGADGPDMPTVDLAGGTNITTSPTTVGGTIGDAYTGISATGNAGSETVTTTSSGGSGTTDYATTGISSTDAHDLGTPSTDSVSVTLSLESDSANLSVNDHVVGSIGSDSKTVDGFVGTAWVSSVVTVDSATTGLNVEIGGAHTHSLYSSGTGVAGASPGDYAATTTSGEGAHAHTTSDPGHTHQLSDSGHLHTFTSSGSHFHTTNIGTLTHTVTDFGHSHGLTQTAHSHDITLGDHSHGLTEPTSGQDVGHQHGISGLAHTHDVSIGTHSHSITDTQHTHSFSGATEHTHTVTIDYHNHTLVGSLQHDHGNDPHKHEMPAMSHSGTLSHDDANHEPPFLEVIWIERVH